MYGSANKHGTRGEGLLSVLQPARVYDPNSLALVQIGS